MPFHAGRNEGVMKFRKFTATIALTAVLSSSIASSLTPLTVLATDGEVTTTTEESQNSEPVQENDAPAESPSEPTAESAENKVEETKQEEPAPEKEENEASYDGSSSSDAETTRKVLKLPTWSDPRKTLKIRPKLSFLL